MIVAMIYVSDPVSGRAIRRAVEHARTVELAPGHYIYSRKGHPVGSEDWDGRAVIAVITEREEQP